MATEASEAVAAMVLERQRTRTSEHATRATATKATRGWFAKRREAGLKKRHAAKLGRATEPEMLF